MPSRLPSVGGDHEGVLNCVFGERDVAEDASQRRHCLAIHLTEYGFNGSRGGDAVGHASQAPGMWSATLPVASNGRTSMGAPMHSVTLCAQLRAASRSSALIR